MPGTAPGSELGEQFRRSHASSRIYPPSDFSKDGVRVHTDGPNFVPVVRDHEEPGTRTFSAASGVKVPVQSGFTVNVPRLVICLSYRAVGVCHSNVRSNARSAEGLHADLGKRAGPTGSGAATKYPVVVTANVPVMERLEHPLSSAFAVGATLRPSAATAAIVKLFAMVLRVMIISFALISCLHFGRSGLGGARNRIRLAYHE